MITDNVKGQCVMNDKKNKKSNINPVIYFIILSLAATIGLNYMLNTLTAPQREEIYYSDFIKMVEEGKIESVEIKSDTILIYPKGEKKEENTALAYLQSFAPSNKVQYYTGVIDDPNLVGLLKANNVKFKKGIVENNLFMELFVSWILPALLLYLFFGLIMRSMGRKMGGGTSGGCLCDVSIRRSGRENNQYIV